MYKVSKLIKITYEDGTIRYAVPAKPMENWDDFTLVDDSEIDFEEDMEGPLAGRSC